MIENYVKIKYKCGKVSKSLAKIMCKYIDF